MDETGDIADAKSAREVDAEVHRVLGVPPGCHLEVLGFRATSEASAPTPDGQALRRAYRRVALLVHPDKNPGFEKQCQEALVRVQEAREALEIKSGAGRCPQEHSSAQGGRQAHSGAERRRRESSEATEPPPKRRGRTSTRKPTEVGASGDLEEHAEAHPRRAFDSAEAFVVHALLHCLALWQSRTSRGAAEAGSDAGAVVNSQPLFHETAVAVMSLRRMLEEGALGLEHVSKLEQMCSHLLAGEDVLANQAYLDLSIGNRTWHADVPSLLEAGCSWAGRKAGVERGRLFQQARTAQRLNSERAASVSVFDDEAVKGHLTKLKRLLTVKQGLKS